MSITTVPEIAEVETPAHFQNLTPGQRRLVHAIVWDGLPLSKAAKKAGVSRSAGFWMANQPHVRRAIKAEEAALRSSARSRALHRLQELAEQDEARSVAVTAAKFLASGNDDGVPGGLSGASVVAGYVIDLAQGPPREPALSEARLTIGANPHRPGSPSPGNR